MPGEVQLGAEQRLLISPVRVLNIIVQSNLTDRNGPAFLQQAGQLIQVCRFVRLEIHGMHAQRRIEAGVRLAQRQKPGPAVGGHTGHHNPAHARLAAPAEQLRAIGIENGIIKVAMGVD